MNWQNLISTILGGLLALLGGIIQQKRAEKTAEKVREESEKNALDLRMEQDKKTEELRIEQETK